MSATILLVFALVLSVVAAGIPDPWEPWRLRTFAAAFAFYVASMLPWLK